MTCGTEVLTLPQLCHATKTYLDICHAVISPSSQSKPLKIMKTLFTPKFQYYLFLKAKFLYQKIKHSYLLLPEQSIFQQCPSMELDSPNVLWGCIKNGAKSPRILRIVKDLWANRFTVVFFMITKEGRRKTRWSTLEDGWVYYIPLPVVEYCAPLKLC